MPKLSIITINFNNKAGLENTINSVFKQTSEDFEYIVIDGNSKDGSQQLIEENANKLTYFISEADTGVYNAMNKGISKATGEYILFLNSGDYLHESTTIADCINQLHTDELIYGHLYLKRQNELILKKYPKELSFLYFIRDSLPHPATFIKKELFQINGLYNEKMRICSDWAFFLDTICKYNVNYRSIEIAISVFDLTGISSSSANISLIKKEKKDYLNQNYKRFYPGVESLLDDSTRLNHFRNSRLLKYFSYIFPQFKL